MHLPRQFDPGRSRRHVFPSRSGALSSAARESEFLRGAPLVLIPALFAIPAWTILVYAPRFRHAGLIASFVFPLFAVMLVFGVRKLLRCLRLRELDLTGALAFGVLLILCVMLLYACVFFFAVNRAFI